MVNERAVLTQVTEARSKVGSVQISAKDLENPELMARFEQAQGQLSSALSRLIAVSENYPQRSEEHTSELQSLMRISYAVFCLKKKKYTTEHTRQNITNNV